MSDIFEPILSTTEKRVTKAAPNQQRCLIENCDNDRAVVLAHVLRRELSLDESLLDSLEWHWGLKKGTINLDTHRNTFFLGASLYELYRQNKWVLLPEDEVLDRYVYDDGEAVVREDFPVFQEKTFRYRFVPLFDMDDIYLARQSSDSPSQVDIHEYPFDTLPLLISHVHPMFVLMHTSRVCYSDSILPMGAVSRFDERYPIVRRLNIIYCAWASMVPDGAYRHRTYVSYPLLHRRYNSDDTCSEADAIDCPPHDLDCANEFTQPQLPSTSFTHAQDERPDTLNAYAPGINDSSVTFAHTPPHRIRLLFASRRRLMGAYRNSESEACQSACGGERNDGVEDHVVPEVPIRYSAGWSPETIAEWARNTQVAHHTVKDE
ncbi:hypothetical protein CVT24_000414 [Panaeolus cyanescens]|uniref:HNH nuclease domain-containing protein n=1 Tax=Panaeolus cyanescens TaxID=181874 RepID=A0A409WP76_9AGAR|nr:hypothetical protein CVT24_000414 [Panaeolus cyanescens]